MNFCRIACLFFFLTPYTSASENTAATNKADGSRTKYACELLAEIGIDWSDQSYVTFQPKPEYFSSSSAWVLHWDTVPIAIPMIQYSHLAVNSNGSLMLLSGEEDILVSMRSDRYDEFSIESLSNGKISNPPDNIKTFHLDMFRRSLSTTPDDIDCNSVDQTKQLLNISSLLMKPLVVFGADTIAYDNFGPLGGILVRGTTGMGTMSEIYIADPSDSRTVINISYKTDQESIYTNFYQNMGAGIQPAKSMPEWILLLDRLIESWDVTAMRLLADENGLKFVPLDLNAEEALQAIKDRPQDFEPLLDKYR